LVSFAQQTCEKYQFFEPKRVTILARLRFLAYTMYSLNQRSKNPGATRMVNLICGTRTKSLWTWDGQTVWGWQTGARNRIRRAL
jgi:hypothetical protein